MNKEEKIQLIEDYLDEKLNPEQHLLFQQQMENDAALLQDVKMHQLLMKGIVLEKKLGRYKDHLHELRKDTSVFTIDIDSKKTKEVLPLWRWGGAIAAMILIGISYFWLSSSSGPEKLFTKYYQPYRGSVVASVVRGDSLLSTEQAAIQAYDNRNYIQAVPLLEKITQQEKSLNWRFYLGIAYLETGDLKKAESSLTVVARDSGSLFYRQAQWYLALVFLKQNNTDQAKEILLVLKKQPGTYAEKANLLLKEI